MSKTHAEILAEIARQVVEEHRGECVCHPATGIFNHPETGICQGVVGDFYRHPSWDYALPEEYQT